MAGSDAEQNGFEGREREGEGERERGRKRRNKNENKKFVSSEVFCYAIRGRWESVV